MGKRLNWECVSAAVIGTSHVERDGVCQDRASASLHRQGTRPWLALFVADGAGSASHGEHGAQMAIDVATACIERMMSLPEIGLGDELAVETITAIRAEIYATAEQAGYTARDFACTFIALLSSDLGTLAFQIGDGGVVLDVGEGLELAIQPMNGEYANMTHFVTDEDALDHLVSRSFSGIVLRAAAFSDGVQRLAIDMATGTPHTPFFAPFFNVLGTVTPDKRDQLPRALETFLSSEKVNERTDDDKSMALALLRG